MGAKDVAVPAWRRGVRQGLAIAALVAAGAAMLVAADVAGRTAGQRWPWKDPRARARPVETAVVLPCKAPCADGPRVSDAR